MICTPAIQHMIRDRKTHSIFTAIQTGMHHGMLTLDDSLVALYRRGLLDRAEMLRVAEQPADVLHKLGEPVPAGMQGGHPPQQHEPPHK
jgi:twitching motility protein PilT